MNQEPEHIQTSLILNETGTFVSKVTNTDVPRVPALGEEAPRCPVVPKGRGLVPRPQHLCGEATSSPGLVQPLGQEAGLAVGPSIPQH